MARKRMRWSADSPFPYATESGCLAELGDRRAAAIETDKQARLMRESKRFYGDYDGVKASQLAIAGKHARAAQCISANDPRLAATSPSTQKPPKVAAIPPARTYTPVEESAGVIPYVPGRPIIALVKLNGRTTARLILDTGASVSLIHPQRLRSAGIDLSQPAARGKVVGVAGEAEAAYYSMTIEVAGHRALVPRVAAYDMGDGDSDGLLGRDFLDRFKMTTDPVAGTVTLVPR